jgi:hypothetical protein
MPLLERSKICIVKKCGREYVQRKFVREDKVCKPDIVSDWAESDETLLLRNEILLRVVGEAWPAEHWCHVLLVVAIEPDVLRDVRKSA